MSKLTIYLTLIFMLLGIPILAQSIMDPSD